MHAYSKVDHALIWLIVLSLMTFPSPFLDPSPKIDSYLDQLSRGCGHLTKPNSPEKVNLKAHATQTVQYHVNACCWEKKGNLNIMNTLMANYYRLNTTGTGKKQSF